jgi:iron complex transport system ATP-binding protein
MLGAEQISYRVGDTTVVSETSLEVESGEFIAIVGPNGAGKTTLLAMFAGELRPTSGVVTLGGLPLDDLSLEERARLRAYLPPQPMNDLAFSVRDVVAMGRHPWRSEERETDEEVEMAMRVAGVEELADRVFGSLSTGEAQLAQIARIVAQGTPLLLLDEPTAGMDIGHQERILQTLADSGRGATVIAAIHDLNAAASVSDRMVILSNGSPAALGTPSQVLEDALLSDVYDHPIAVVDHPFRDGPLVLLRGG